MVSESGDMKLLGNLRKFIDFTAAATGYQPSNTLILNASMDAQYTACLALVQDLSNKAATLKVRINEREALFLKLRPLVTRIHNVAIASGASPALLDDMTNSKRKLTGARKSKKAAAPATGTPGPAAGTPGPPAARTISVSQMSYENQVGNFNDYIELVATVSGYNPNEADLKVTALRAYAAQLQAANEAVVAAMADEAQARGSRDNALYSSETSVVMAGQIGKAYVRGAFGTDSAVWSQVKGLKFESPFRKR